MAARRRAGRGARVMLMGAAARVSTQRRESTVDSADRARGRARPAALRKRCGYVAALVPTCQYCLFSRCALSTAYSHLHTDTH